MTKPLRLVALENIRVNGTLQSPCEQPFLMMIDLVALSELLLILVIERQSCWLIQPPSIIERASCDWSSTNDCTCGLNRSSMRDKALRRN